METKSKNKRKILSTIVGAILCVIFIPVIVVNITLLIKTYTDTEHLPSILGIKPVVVLSGSMSPMFNTESMIFIKDIDASTLQKGDIICYLENGTAITHRIDDIVTEDGETKFVTKGDANNTTDSSTVAYNQVEGQYIGKIEGLGGIVMFMQTTTGMILFVVLPIFLYLAWDILSRKREGKKERQRTAQLEAQLAEMQKENKEPSEKISKITKIS